MLNEIEELYLDDLIKSAERSIDPGYGNSQIYPPEQILAIFRRFKEINDECSRYALELQKANEEVARLHEVYGA